MSGSLSVGAPSQLDPGALQQAQQGSAIAPGDAAHEQAFAQAIQQSAPVQELDATAASGGDGVMSGIMQRLDSVAAHMRTDPASQPDMAQNDVLFSGDPASVQAAAPDAKAHDSLKDVMASALDNYKSSIVFSVEAQVASNGSSTSTKTFNNLLKGS